MLRVASKSQDDDLAPNLVFSHQNTHVPLHQLMLTLSFSGDTRVGVASGKTMCKTKNIVCLSERKKIPC